METNRLAQKVEAHGPKVVAVGLLAAAWANGWMGSTPKEFVGLLQATINVAAIAVGFLVAAKGILISSHDREIVKNLKAAKQFLPLVNYFIAATGWCLSLCLLSAWLLVIDLGHVSPFTQYLLWGWIALLGGAGVASARVIYLFNKILRNMAK